MAKCLRLYERVCVRERERESYQTGSQNMRVKAFEDIDYIGGHVT